MVFGSTLSAKIVAPALAALIFALLVQLFVFRKLPIEIAEV